MPILLHRNIDLLLFQVQLIYFEVPNFDELFYFGLSFLCCDLSSRPSNLKSLHKKFIFSAFVCVELCIAVFKVDVIFFSNIAFSPMLCHNFILGIIFCQFKSLCIYILEIQVPFALIYYCIIVSISLPYQEFMSFKFFIFLFVSHVHSGVHLESHGFTLSLSKYEKRPNIASHIFIQQSFTFFPIFQLCFSFVDDHYYFS